MGVFQREWGIYLWFWSFWLKNGGETHPNWDIIRNIKWKISWVYQFVVKNDDDR